MESTGKRNRVYQDNNVCVPCICPVLYFDAYNHIFTIYFESPVCTNEYGAIY